MRRRFSRCALAWAHERTCNERGNGCGPAMPGGVAAERSIRIGPYADWLPAGSECPRRLQRRPSACPGRPVRALVVGARGLRGGLGRLHDGLLQVVDRRSPDGFGRSVGRVRVVPGIVDRRRGELCIDRGGAKVALRAAGESEGEGDREGGFIIMAPCGSGLIMMKGGANASRKVRASAERRRGCKACCFFPARPEKR
jgi:hypothetical protein